MNHHFALKIIVAIITIMGTNYEFAHARKRSLNEMNAIAASVFSDNKVDTRTMASTDIHCVLPLSISCKSKEIEGLKSVVSTEDAFYIYTYKDGRPGYVIVSTDDHLPEVLAFSETDHLNTKELPSSMMGMLSDYIYISDAVQQTEVTTSNETNSSVEPLLGDIAFAQRAPYNDKCPSYNGEKTLTGCVSTAMSQVMAYHQHPKRMEGDYISYTTEKLQIPVGWDCSSTYFDWNHMLGTYSQEVADYTENETITEKEYMVLTGMKTSEEYKNYLEVYRWTNTTSTTLYATVQLLLMDETGNFIRPIGTPKRLDGLKPRYYYSTFYFKHSFPSNLSDGQYRLYVGIKLDGTSEWSIAKRAVNESNIYNSERTEYYIPVTKSGFSYSFEGISYSCGYNATQADAVATLCAASGAASEMDYTPDASSANVLDARNALIKYMGYDESIAYVDKSYFAPEGWLEFMKNELKNGRPMYCSGHPESGSGHAFIIDGFRYLNEQLYFHVNWGWNGGSNGYFLIDYLQPSEAGDGGYETNYGYNLRLLTGISPDNGMDEGLTLGAKGATLSFPNKPTELEISLDRLTNCSYKDFSGEVLAYATNDKYDIYLGNVFTYGLGWKPDYYFYSINGTLAIPPYTPNGTYTLQLRALEYDSETETPVLIPGILTFTYNGNSTEGISSPSVSTGVGTSEICDLMGRKVYKTKPGNIYIIHGKKVYVE